MKMTNGIGPNTLPWGIPFRMSAHVDSLPFTAFIQLGSLRSIPHAFKFLMQSLVMGRVESFSEIQIR